MKKAPFRHPERVLGRLAQTHRRVGIVPSSDDSLRYVLPVPRGWGRVSGLGASPAAGRSEILGLFASKADLAGPRLIVSATRLRWDVDPLGWVRHHWEKAGWSVAVAAPLDGRWHPRFEVGALRRIEGEVEVRRCTGFVDNGRLLRVDVAAPLPQWRELHDRLWPCGVLFSLAKPTYRRDVEAQRCHGGPLVAFGLPASWHARPARAPRPGAERWVASPCEGAERSAALRVDAIPWGPDGGVSIDARQLRVRHELWKQGISLARRVDRLPAGAIAGTPGLAGSFRARARDHEEPFEIRFAHVDIDGLSLDYTAVIASPELFPLDRMRAIRALEIAVTTTRAFPKEDPHAA